jgi:hypothetical protein
MYLVGSRCFSISPNSIPNGSEGDFSPLSFLSRSPLSPPTCLLYDKATNVAYTYSSPPSKFKQGLTAPRCGTRGYARLYLLMLLGSQLSLPSTAPGLRTPHNSFTGLTALATSGARYEVCAAHFERVKRCKLLACKASKEQCGRSLEDGGSNGSRRRRRR